MVKAAPSAALILKDIRAALDSRLDGHGDRGDKSKGAASKSPLKALGVRSSFVRSIARDIQTKAKPSIDYAVALALVDAALAREPAKRAVVKKWAKLKNVGKRHLAVLAAMGLVTDGHREAAAVLTLAEALLDEQHPVMIGAVARLLRETTRVDAKAVQDFLFRRSIDGNPDILRAGSENLDAARRAALIAKLEAQAALAAPLAAPLATAER